MTSRKERISGARFTKVETQALPVTTADGHRLMLTRKKAPSRKKGIPIVLVHGLGQNRYSWHMESMSFACALVEEGFDVFIAELRGHGLSGEAGSQPPGSFDDYVFLDMPAILEEVGRKTNGRKAFLCGHSLGGSIAYALDPSMHERIAGIVSIAGPSHFGKGLPHFTLPASFAVTVFDKLGLDRIPQPKTPIGFPVGWVANLYRLPVMDWKFLDHPLALWSPGSMEQPVIKERLTKGFDRTGWEIIKSMTLWAGTGRFFDKARTSVYEDNLAAKDMPLLFVLGDDDKVVPASSVLPGYELAKSIDKSWRTFVGKVTGHGWGHLDLVFGKRAPDAVWPLMIEWMQQRASSR